MVKDGFSLQDPIESKGNRKEFSLYQFSTKLESIDLFLEITIDLLEFWQFDVYHVLMEPKKERTI